MAKANVDFLWYKKGDSVPDSDLEKHPNWAQYVEQTEEDDVPVKEESPKKKSKWNFDVNNDGKVDLKDIGAMAKKLGSRGGRPKKKGKKK